MPKINFEKTDGFLVLFIAVQLAGLFGFADWQPSADMLAAIDAGIAFLATALRLLKSAMHD